MRAKVRFFARLADLAGTREADVDLGEGLHYLPGQSSCYGS